jgi:hypothetical protein
VDVVSHFSTSRRRLLHRSGLAGALAASLLSFSFSLRAQTSRCLLSGDTTVSQADVTAATKMAIGTQTCTATLEGSPPVCTVITVQRVTNAIPSPPSNPNPPCVAYNTHASNLSWNVSTSSGVTAYNVYRATAVGGPYTVIASLISATTYCSNGSTCAWSDTAVTAGLTYYYEVTAVAAGVESSPTSPVQGTIPTP